MRHETSFSRADLADGLSNSLTHSVSWHRSQDTAPLAQLHPSLSSSAARPQFQAPLVRRGDVPQARFTIFSIYTDVRHDQTYVPSAPLREEGAMPIDGSSASRPSLGRFSMRKYSCKRSVSNLTSAL